MHLGVALLTVPETEPEVTNKCDVMHKVHNKLPLATDSSLNVHCRVQCIIRQEYDTVTGNLVLLQLLQEWGTFYSNIASTVKMI